MFHTCNRGPQNIATFLFFTPGGFLGRRPFPVSRREEVAQQYGVRRWGRTMGINYRRGVEGQRFEWWSWSMVPITDDVNLAGETYETRLTRHEVVNERERRRCTLLARDSSPRSCCHANRKTTKRTAVSRDSTGNFVNFNLYPCPSALFIRLSATRTVLLTRQRKTGDFSASASTCTSKYRRSIRSIAGLVWRAVWNSVWTPGFWRGWKLLGVS